MSKTVTITYNGQTTTYAHPADALTVMISYMKNAEDDGDYYAMQEARRALSVDSVYAALWDFDQHMREIHKYSLMPTDNDSHKTLLKEFQEDFNGNSVTRSEKEVDAFVDGVEALAFYARQSLNQFLNENGINVEELYN